MLSGLVKRGLTIAQAPPNDRPHTPDDVTAKAVMLLTIAVFVFAMSLVGYVYQEVIATLAIIEEPSATAYIITDSDSCDPDSPLLSTSEKAGEATEPEVHLVRNRLITSSFRATLHHLRSRDGWTGPFRGAVIRLVYCFALVVAVTIITALIPALPSTAATIIAVVLCSRLDLAWNNIVISERSPKYWFRRLPSLNAWFKVIPAAALYALADQLVVVLPAQLARMIGLRNVIDRLANGPADPAERRALMHAACHGGIAVLLVGVAVMVLVLFPAGVTLTRVQASLLPDTEESIVPFDRTFRGKVVPEIVGGSGVVGILDAWRTFGWSSRIRLLRVYAKVAAIQIALFTLFVIAMFTEIVHFFPEFHVAFKLWVNGMHETNPAA
ncbi:hypothetical protein GP486_006025 [Trichoglossum hirsutum]|uniref:Uncharacterized protein n=1 Tax=Trichoglossum hirsutum TaxID=265104 RepID=A0A9P8L861_9PEZI|nr:hypothetical protein GP486_006025 [Trichoglossum hirsutum]